MNRNGRAVLGIVVGLGMLAMLPAAVLAASPACGDTLTANTTLHADLDCSGYAGTGLTLGASDITLNLGGHTLWGPSGADGQIGVYTTYNRTTITNGTIANYTHGADSDGPNRTTISWLTVNGENPGSDYGVEVYGGVHSVLNHVATSNVYYGATVESGALQTIKNSVLSASYIGLYTEYETRDTISNNTAHASYGFYDDYSQKQNYTGNTANGGTTGFYLDCDSYGKIFLTNNTATGNSEYGFYVYECYGPDYGEDPGTGSKVTGNVANGNNVGFYDYYSINEVWKSNSARDNSDDGFYFDYPTAARGSYNTAIHNGGDGFQFDDNYSYYNWDDFSYNTSKRNSGYAYYAGYGVPGTGNVNVNNGSGCHNVDC